MEIPYSKEEIRAATLETITAQRPEVLLHPPARLPRRRPDGPVPARLPGRRDRSRSGSGAPTSATRASRTASARKVSSWRRIRADALIPTAKAGGPVPQLRAGQDRGRQGRLRGGDPARPARLVCEGTGENLFLVKDGKIATPGFANDILGGINRLAAIEIARDQGYEVVERDIARGELYRADEIFMTGTAAELTPIREVDDLPVGDGTPRPDHDARSRRSSRTRCTGARSATPTGWTWCPRRHPPREPDPRLRHHPARRDAGGGDVAVRRGEGARRAAPRRARRSRDRGGLPDLEPEGGGALRAPREASASPPTCAPSG